MRPARSILLFVLFNVPFLFLAQIPVSGLIRDKTGEPIPGAAVKVLRSDSSMVTGTVSDAEGKFRLVLLPGRYQLSFSSISYREQTRNLEVKNAPLEIAPVTLSEDAEQLKEVEVEAVQARGEQKGDTTSFNAGAYKTNPDASAEDLVKKMPGVTNDNEGLKVNGEAVQKVLVDGKPFFGDDPSAALRNLPAEIIDKVEVFDKLSDQAQFTGFDDGSQQKTINLVTKKGRNKGQFGRAYAGAGVDDGLNPRYNAGAALNSFTDKRRVTLLLLSNNVNQQNFSSADISEATGSQGQQRGGRGGRRGSNGLSIPGRGGISETNALGLNYGDAWGKKTEVTGSYLFNRTLNRNASDIVRSYFSQEGLTYNESSSDKNTGDLHRANLRLEHNIDSNRRIVWRPSFTLRNDRRESFLEGVNSMFDGVQLSSTRTQAGSESPSYDLNNELTYMHRFRKRGRSVSVDLSHRQAENLGSGNYEAVNFYEDTTSSALDQQFSQYGRTQRAEMDIDYTEPVSKHGQVQVSYEPGLTRSESTRNTRDYNVAFDDYSLFNTSLSNKYTFDYVFQRGGLSYLFNKHRLNFNIGAEAQSATLAGEQFFPQTFTVRQRFGNILPYARLNFKGEKSRNLRVNYRARTNIPEMQQLQDVADISNPLQVTAGNPALKQTFEQSLFARYGGFDKETSRNLMVYVHGRYVDDYITNSTYVLRRDTTIRGFVIREGSQVTRPVNLDGYVSARAFGVLGFPLKKLKSNLSINGGFTYNRQPALVNDILNRSNSYSGTGGVFIGSNISEDLDFSLGYNGSYTEVRNDRQSASDNTYFTHSGTAGINWILKKRVVFGSDIRFNVFRGLQAGFNQDFVLWNGAVGYKFLENRALDVRLSVFDILSQNRAVGRNINAAYTEDYHTVVLQRYFMVTASYTLRKFGGND